MAISEKTEKPKKRSALRSRAGMAYYGMRRRLLWLKMRKIFAAEKASENLPFCSYRHKTPLIRKLRDVDMWLQENKIVNLKIAAARLDGIVLHPGEIFSYWRLIGKPTAKKGYLKGMVLKNGSFFAETGGGLCQLSNLIFWMTVHTPLTVVERHRHGYDVFPDSDRTQPFGSGATCFYPHGDLMVQNNTGSDYQLRVWVDETHLHGEWRCSEKSEYRYEIEERRHEMRAEYWGGYSRCNELYQKVFDSEGQLVSEKLIVKNSAIMMYSPFLNPASESADSI